MRFHGLPEGSRVILRGILRTSLVPGLLVAMSLLNTPRAEAQELGISVGEMAPAAVIETLDGASADLAQWIGKTPVLLEFWATWCSSCRQLEPTLKSAFDTYGDRVRFIGVAVSVNQSRERVRRHLAEHAMPLHEMLYDPDADASEAFEAPATSYVVVIDAGGKVVYTGIGGRQDLQGALARAVGGDR